MSQTQALTLGELLDGDLGLERLAASDAALERRVAGAHSIEIEHPGTWLERDWVMLTTGVRLRHSAQTQRDLVAELDELGACALGFGVEVIFKRVPPALLDEAEKRDLPVFSVPLRTPFRDVISAVNGSLINAEVRSLQRLSSLQLFLIDALEDGQPRQAVIQRLANFAEATVTLFSSTGAVVEATDAAPTETIWQEITTRPAALIQFEHAGRETIATPLGSGRGKVSWLALSSDRSRRMPRIARAAARTTAPVLAALARLDDLAEAQDRAIRGAVLDTLLDSDDTSDIATLAARAAALGIDFTEPASVVLIASTDDSPPASAEYSRPELELELQRRSLPFLAATRGEVCAFLVQSGPEAIRSLLLDLFTDEGTCIAGIGRPAADVNAVPDSLRDARFALQHSKGSPDRILSFDKFDLATLVVSEISSERLERKVDEVTDILCSNASLYDAVVAYFEHDLDVMQTAKAMHLHHNSLRYRLRRVESLMGQSLKNPATISSLYLALTSKRSTS